jgi:ATP-dependent exoDNAse (exonuclease V) beta subunit
MIFSTVHRAKGMEYDVVYLVDDFITEEKLVKLKDKEEPINTAKFTEEINLLYVAVTRAKYKLYIPETLVPRGVPVSKHIKAGKKTVDTRPAGKQVQPGVSSIFRQSTGKKTQSFRKPGEKPYAVVEKKQSHKEAYQPWSPELDKELKAMADTGASIGEMAEHFGRTKGAVYARLKKLDYFS